MSGGVALGLWRRAAGDVETDRITVGEKPIGDGDGDGGKCLGVYGTYSRRVYGAPWDCAVLKMCSGRPFAARAVWYFS